MRKILNSLFVVGLVLGLTFAPAAAQNPNPQQSFNAQVQLAAPSLWLNYNDPTANFVDSVSGLSFGNTVTYTKPTPVSSCPTFAVVSAMATCTFTTYAGETALISAAWYTAGTVTSVTDSGSATGTLIATQSLSSGGGYSAYYVMPNLTAGSHTLTIRWNTAPSYVGASAVGYLGVNTTTPIDTFVDAIGSGTAISSGALTTTGANELVVGAGQVNNCPTITAGTPAFTWYTTIGCINQGYLAAPTVGPYTFNATSAVSKTWSAIEIALKPQTQTVVVLSGTVATQQSGFDNTNPANYSAAFPYNAGTFAPNNTLGAIDWSSPWSMMVHVDTLGWNRTGTLVLASKGDSGSGSNSWWKLTLQGNAQPSLDKLCFIRSGPTTSGTVGSVGNQTCTSVDTAVGYNYNVVVTDSGAGTGAALQFYVNGVGPYGVTPLPQASASNSFQFGFGAVNLTISGGTGYAASTAFTSSGGGTNCHVYGSIPASGGVPTAGILASSFFNNYNAGCTSLPTINLTAPTGTGISVVPSLAGGSMNSTTYPVMAPGYVSGGGYNGIDQADSTQTATKVDEFAIWNRALTPTEIYNIFYQTKFYQGILPATPTHIPVMLSEIVCPDYDSTTTLSVLIRLHQLGYVNLLGVAIDQDGGTGAALFRQMLDQAGLNNIPLGLASNASAYYSTGPGSGMCQTANIAAYNASTPVIYTAYPTAAQVFRKVFAANPTTAITLLTPTTLYGTYDFMDSAADGISSLTGAQLWLQNVTNGGVMYLEGGPFCGQTASLPVTSPCSGSVTGDNSLYYPAQGQYVLAHLQGIPLYLMAGSPDSNGPGVLNTRTSFDPLYLASVGEGMDSRTGWDSLGTMALFTPLFSGSLQIAYSGGTGYANYTKFTVTGGGPNCKLDAWLTASGGVPNGIATSFGQNYGAVQWYYVYGHGCTAVPTLGLVSPTGTGVTLTAYLSAVCGTDTITQPSGTWTDSFSSTTCSNQYTLTFPWEANPLSANGGSPIYRWLMNSLENPVPAGQPRAQ